MACHVPQALYLDLSTALEAQHVALFTLKVHFEMETSSTWNRALLPMELSITLLSFSASEEFQPQAHHSTLHNASLHGKGKDVPVLN
jgi:hypothetical protein